MFSILRNEKLRIFLPLISALLYLYLILSSNNTPIFIVLIYIILLVITFFCNKNSNSSSSVSNVNKSYSNTIVATMYGIVAGFAITKSLEVMSGALQVDEYNIKNMTLMNLIDILTKPTVLLFFSFISTAIPFYHGATIFLIRKKLSAEKFKITLFNFGMLFTEATILYELAISIDSLQRFTFWLLLLMIIDLLWFIILMIIGRKDKSKSTIQQTVMPINWFHLNVITIPLIIYFNITNNCETLYLLPILLIGRTITDYLTTPLYKQYM